MNPYKQRSTNTAESSTKVAKNSKWKDLPSSRRVILQQFYCVKCHTNKVGGKYDWCLQCEETYNISKRSSTNVQTAYNRGGSVTSEVLFRGKTPNHSNS